MTKQLIALVRAAVLISSLIRILTDFVLREDVQTLIVKLHQALDAIIQKLDADHQVSIPTADIPTAVYHNQRMAAAFLGCSEKTVYRYRKQGALPFSYDKQGNIRYAEHDLEKLFERIHGFPKGGFTR